MLKHLALILTAARLAVSPLAFWLILEYRDETGASWYLFGLAFLVAASDLWDGKLARHYSATTRFGAFLDPIADKVIVLGCALCFSLVDRYWILPVAILFLREVVIGLLRSHYLRKGLNAPASTAAKWKTTAQGGALALAACPLLSDVQNPHTVAIWLAVGLTCYTGIQYLASPKTMIKEEGNSK